jgi:predicted hydrocarbon binding protein
MQIKDKVVGWYVKHYLMPRAQIIDKPGFVIFNVTGKTQIFARQIIIPESFFVLLEKQLRDKLGDEGKRLLYSTGKRFGVRFSIMGSFSKKGEMADNKLSDYIGMVNKFIEGTYASDISAEIDVSKKRVLYDMKNFVVCSKIKNASFLPLGAGCGLIAYILDDETIEGVHLECQSAGNKTCKILYAPMKELEKEGYTNVFKETNLKGLEFSPDYEQMNSIQETENSQYSFNQLIDAGLFSFEQGIILRNNQRYFIYEISGIYLLEQELGKNSIAKKILYDVSYETGKNLELVEKDENPLKGIIDLLTAFGWGDVLILEKSSKYFVNIKYFPWTKFYEEIDFIVFRGLLAGMLSSVSNRDVKFKDVEKDVSQGYLSLVFSE